jgi:hypothetical protein
VPSTEHLRGERAGDPHPLRPWGRPAPGPGARW